MSLRLRKLLASIILGISIAGAMYVAVPGDNVGVKKLPDDKNQAVHWTVDVIDTLNRLEIVHVISHILIFGGSALLLGPWGNPRGSTGLAWRYVLGAAILMEGGQIVVGHMDDTFSSLFYATTFDLIVDVMAAAVALWLLNRRAQLHPVTAPIDPVRKFSS